MLYQVQPPGTVLWVDMPRSMIEVARKHPEADLARLDWQPSSERPYSVQLLRAALRLGVPCGTGIVVDGVDLVPVGRVEELRRVLDRSSEAQAAPTPGTALMEQLIPGWTERGREIDRGVAQSFQRAVEQAEREEREVFARPVPSELAAHWERLGGHLPDPL